MDNGHLSVPSAVTNADTSSTPLYRQYLKKKFKYRVKSESTEWVDLRTVAVTITEDIKQMKQYSIIFP